MSVDVISTLSVWLTDQDGEHLDLRREKFTIRFHLCERWNQVDTLKDAVRLKKGITLCFPNGGIRGDRVLLLTPAQINRLDKAQVQGKRVQIRFSARQLAKNVSYIGGFIMSLVRAFPFITRALPTVLSGLATGQTFWWY